MAYKLGLALGGGGVRGLANIGVLMALEEAGLRPGVLSGTSMGAIVGAVYADTLDASRTETIIKDYLGSEAFLKQTRRLNPSPGDEQRILNKIFHKAKKGYFFYRFVMHESIVSEGLFMEINHIIPDKFFHELKMPFACMAMDLVSGLPEIFHGGPVRPAVRASSAVPGMLAPVAMGRGMYADGGWVENVPVSAARFLGADFVIGADVSRDITNIDYQHEIKNSMDILSRANDVARAMMNTYRVRDADFIIHPEVGDAPWSSFDNMDDYIKAGYHQAMLVMPQLKKYLKRGRLQRWWKKCRRF